MKALYRLYRLYRFPVIAGIAVPIAAILAEPGRFGAQRAR